MTVKPTSIWAYREHLNSGKARTQRDKIYLAMMFMNHPVNRNEICEMTGFRINAVCGRVNELLKMQVVEVAHKKVDPNGPATTPVEYLRCIPPEEQPELAPQQGRLL